MDQDQPTPEVKRTSLLASLIAAIILSACISGVLVYVVIHKKETTSEAALQTQIDGLAQQLTTAQKAQVTPTPTPSVAPTETALATATPSASPSSTTPSCASLTFGLGANTTAGTVDLPTFLTKQWLDQYVNTSLAEQCQLKSYTIDDISTLKPLSTANSYYYTLTYTLTVPNIATSEWTAGNGSISGNSISKKYAEVKVITTDTTFYKITEADTGGLIGQ